MAYGFEIVDESGNTFNDTTIGMTLIGTDTFTGEGNFVYTFPLESPPDYVFGYVVEITDAPTTDTIEPQFHKNLFPLGGFTSQTAVDNTTNPGVCVINGDLNFSYVTENDCINHSGTWDTTTPYFAYFAGNIAYQMIAKAQADGCLSTGTVADYKANTDLTIYFYALGAL